MRIDVIIPAYNARGTLFRALCSVGMQSIAPETDVTVVDDASTDGGYEEIVSAFEAFLSVRLLRLAENRGPGFARQYGIDHTENPLIAFLDADDTFFESFSLERMRQVLEANANSCGVSGGLVVMGPGKESLQHFTGNDPGGSVVGRIYRRAFLQRQGISFPDSRANEDAGFSILVRLCAAPNEAAMKIRDVVYCAHYSPGGLFHGGKKPFRFDEGFAGCAENMSYAIRESMKRSVPVAPVFELAVRTMYSLYLLLMKCLTREPELVEQNWRHCRRFWEEVYHPIEDLVPRETHERLYAEVTTQEFGLGPAEAFIPAMSLQSFLDRLADG